MANEPFWLIHCQVQSDTTSLGFLCYSSSKNEMRYLTCRRDVNSTHLVCTSTFTSYPNPFSPMNQPASSVGEESTITDNIKKLQRFEPGSITHRSRMLPLCHLCLLKTFILHKILLSKLNVLLAEVLAKPPWSTSHHIGPTTQEEKLCR